MIELNLLPHDMREYKKKRQSRLNLNIEFRNIPVKKIAITAAAVFIGIHLLISAMLALQKASLFSMTRKLSSLSEQERQIQQAKKELDSLNKKLLVIDSLASGSLLWSKKLHDLSEAVIDGVWLTSLSLKTETPIRSVSSAGQPAAPMQGAVETMVLQGCAIAFTTGEGPAIVGKFINSLKSHKGFFNDFDEIKLSSIQRREIGKTEVMDFTIICYFKSGRSYFEKLEGAGI